MGWFTTTDEAIAALASNKDSKRLWALRKLQDKATDAGRKQRIGQHDVAVKQVVHMLSDPSPEIQATAAETIAAVVAEDPSNQERVGSEPGAVDGLVKNLGSSNTGLHLTTAAALRNLATDHPANQERIGAAGAVEGLVPLLGSSDTGLQMVAAAALCRLAQAHPGNQERIGAAAGAVEGLVALLGSSDANVQGHASSALHMLAHRHMFNRVAITSHPGALPGLARLVGCSDCPALQEAATRALLSLCLGCPANACQLVEQCPGALQQLVQLATTAAGPDEGLFAAVVLVCVAASCARGRQLLVEQPAALTPLAQVLESAYNWNQEDVHEIMQSLLAMARADARMWKMVVASNTQLVAALQQLASSSSDATTRNSAQEVLALVNTKAADSPSSVQVHDTAPRQDQLPSSKPPAPAPGAPASSTSGGKFAWEPPQQSAEVPWVYKAAAPLATALGTAAAAVRFVPKCGPIIAGVKGAAQSLLLMVDQVRINKAKVRALGGREEGLLQYRQALEPSWPQVEAAVSQQQWQALETQLLELEAALQRARALVEGYVLKEPMRLQRAMRFLCGKMDFDDLCAVDAAISTTIATLTSITTSLNLVHTVKLGQQLAQQQEVALKQAHAEDEQALRQDLSLLVGGQAALQQQLAEATEEQRQQWQEAVSWLGGIQSGVEQLQGGMERVEVGVEGLSNDMQAVKGLVEELLARTKSGSCSKQGSAAGHVSTTSTRRTVSSQLVLDSKQVVWDAAVKLDSGGFGSVYAGTYHGAPVAVKQLDMAELDEEERHHVFYEAAVLSRLHHPCIVQFFGVVVEQVLPSALSKKQQPRLSLVMERCDTNLAILMRDEGLLPLPRALHITNAIAAALTYLHHTSTVKVVHGDLKPANVLLAEGGRVKLTDFGLSQTIAINTSTLMSKGVVGRGNSSSGGTLLWTPPEVLEAWVAGNDLEAAPAHDIYALGVLLYQLLTGRAPYKQYKREEPFKAAVRAGKRPQWGDWQQEREGQAAAEVLVALQQLAEDCWAQEAGSPPSAQQVQKRLEEMRAQLA